MTNKLHIHPVKIFYDWYIRLKKDFHMNYKNPKITTAFRFDFGSIGPYWDGRMETKKPPFRAA